MSRYDRWEETAWELERPNGSRASITYGGPGYEWTVYAKGRNGTFTGAGHAIDLDEAQGAAVIALTAIERQAHNARHTYKLDGKEYEADGPEITVARIREQASLGKLGPMRIFRGGVPHDREMSDSDIVALDRAPVHLYTVPK